MKPCVFVHTNHKQNIGAKVAVHSFRRYSRNNEKFDVKVIHTADHAFIREKDGQTYLRDGVKRIWLYDDLQSFTPLRFMPPELMGYEGRAVVVDPDVFAVGDVWELLSRDMQGKAVISRFRSGPKGYIDKCRASSVMLLDCAKLKHWRVEEQFRAMFEFKRDYMPWICLKLEDPATLGLFEDEWNDFDRLTEKTKLLHTTRRMTQPWKTGLPIDWRPAERFRLFPPVAWLMRARRHLFGEYGLLGKYRPHPDPNQQNLFFGLLKECLDAGTVTESELRNEMARNHVRHDAFQVLKQTPALPSQESMAAQA